MTEVVASLNAVSETELEQRIAESPEWLAKRRRLAWKAFQELPRPSSARDEDWRRTPINRLDLDGTDSVRDAPETECRHALDRAAAALTTATTIVDAGIGICARNNLEMATAQNVVITSLCEAAQRNATVVEKVLGLIGASESSFLALWNALWRDGVFVEVPAETVVAVPVWTSSVAGAGLSFPAKVISVGANSSLTIVDDEISSPGAVSIGATIVVLGENAEVDFVSIQDRAKDAWHINTQRFVQERNSRLRFFSAAFGAHLEKTYWDVIQNGAGAEADLAGVVIADGDRHLDHQSLQAHRAPDTRSNLLLKVAASDSARSVYSGLIDVEPQAVHADGYVTNRNLLLSHGARASGIPRLEIKANDVRCGHGATVGHLDETERFYLESRGIARSEAARLMVGGFFNNAIDMVRHESLRDWIRLRAEQALAEPR